MQKRGFNIVTVGSNTVDIFIDTGLHEMKKGKKKLIAYSAGAKILVKDTRFETGGGGTNTAVAFSRLGLKTAYLGKIGSGDFGKKVLAMLKKEKIDFIGQKGKGIGGYSVILDSREHHRTILVYKGENDNLGFADARKNKLKTKWFYFSSLMNQSFNTQKKLAVFAENNNIKIAFNPSSYQTKKGKKYIMPILKRTEILILNREEAAMLFKKNPLKNLHKLGPKVVCITDGKKAFYAYDGKYKYTITPHPFVAKERTGAGDAFASGFVAGIAKGKSIEFALQMGLANSESVIRYFGAKNRLLNWREISKKIKNNPGKIKKQKW